MALSSKNPQYSERLPDWQLLRHSYEGERKIKSLGVTYLPATSGMIADGYGATNTSGTLAYTAYITRARYPDHVKEAVENLIGVMHRKPAKIELPAQLEYLLENATLRNESLQLLLRRINEEQLTTGRIGVLADVIDDGPRAGELYCVTYIAEDIGNWDEGASDLVEPQSLNLVVIDESEEERTDRFEWDRVEKYRVLVLGDVDPNEPSGGTSVYRSGEFRDTDGATDFDESQLVEPSVNGRNLDKIPFVFVNAKDLTPEPDLPPLLGLANLTIAIYRGEADYRQGLFMQGQDTLVIIGTREQDADGQHRVGANASLELTIGSDAKYIGVDGQGLPEMRSSLENDYNRAGEKAGQLLDSVSRERESGDALTVRVGARTATLVQIVRAGASGLEKLLKMMAEWVGANPEEVSVEPNLDFTDDEMTGQEASQWMGAKMLSLPIGLETIHEILQRRGVTELTFEEELERMSGEEARGLSMASMEEQADRRASGSNRFGNDDEEDEEDDTDDEDAGGGE